MFQILSTMVVELPSFQEELDEISGMPPNVQLISEPWGHDNHEDTECECQFSVRTAAYVHELSVDKRGSADCLIQIWRRVYCRSQTGIKGLQD